MSLAVNYNPEPLFSRRAYKRHMARTAKAFSAISMGAAFVLTSGEAFAQSSRASAENGFSPLDGQPIGFNEAGDLRVMLASGEEITIPRGEYGLVGDQIMVSDMIDGVEVAQNGYIPPTSDAYPVYGNTGGPFGNLGMGTVLIPLGLILGGILVYFLITRANNDGPAFAEASYTANFEENDTGTVVTVGATDAEGDTFTYSLSGDDAEHFSIDAAGAITFNDEPNFDSPGDAGRNNVYSFNAVATDEHGEASSVPVTVTVTTEPDADVVDATADLAANVSTGNDDITATGALTGFDTSSGNDSVNITTGTMAAGTGDMGSGNDLLTIGNDLGGTPTFDLGSGNDEIVLADDQTDVLTIDLGTGEDIIDIDVAQVTAIHVIQAFGADDLIDLSVFGLTDGLDTTLHANSGDAIAELDDFDVVFYDTGTDIRVLVDADDSDTAAFNATDMQFTIEGVQSLSASQFDFA